MEDYNNKLSLKQQSLYGVFWTFIDIFINKGAYFISTIILARILGPKEFGLLGMIMLFVAIGNTLIDSGMSISLLRTNGVTQKDYDTVFITNILMSLLVYIILFFAAPLIATFYNQPILIDIIRIYSLGFVVNSFRSIHIVKLMKEMQFKKLSILNLPGNLISVFFAIWMGYLGFGIWSLVFLFLINQIISTFLFWIFIKWKPRWIFDYENYKIHLKFGYKLVISAQINTIFENIYNILIGKFYNIKTLGFYERAYSLNSYPTSVLSSIILNVSLPSLALIKNDSKRLHSAYKNILQITFLISTFGLGFGALLAQQFVSLILGVDWLQVVPLFQILSLSFIFFPIHSLNINVLNLFGRSDLYLKLEVVKKVIFLIIISICFNFGILGLVWSSVITSILGLVINTHYSGKYLNYPTIRQFRDLSPVFFVVLISMGVIYSFLLINNSGQIIQIISSFIVGFLTIIILGESIKLSPYIYLKHLTLEYLKK